MPLFNRTVSLYTFYTEKPKTPVTPIGENSSQEQANPEKTKKTSLTRPVVPFKRDISRDVFSSDDEEEDEPVAVSPPKPKARIVFPKLPLTYDEENSSERIVEEEIIIREPDADVVPRETPRPSGIYDHLPWPPLEDGFLFEAPYDKDGKPEEAVITRDQALGFTTSAKYLHFPTSGQTYMMHRMMCYDVTAYWDARDGFERFPKPQNQIRLEKHREYELKNNGEQPKKEDSETEDEPVFWDINECIRRKRKHDGSEDPDAKRPRFGPEQERSLKKNGLIFSVRAHTGEDQKALPYLCGYKQKRN